VAEREANGKFKDIHDFANRVDASVMNRRQLEHLVMAGAFDSLSPNRRQVFESLDMLIASAQSATQDRVSAQVSLFGGEEAASLNRRELKPAEEWSLIEKLNQECAAVGFYLSSHPLEPYAPVLKKLGVSSSARLETSLPDRQNLKLVGILSAIKLRSSPRGRSAFLTLTDAHGQYEVTIFDEHLLDQHHAMLKAGTPLLLSVDVRHSERGQRLLVNRIDLLDAVAQNLRPNLLSMTVEDVDALPQLKAMLGEVKDRGTRVELLVTVPTGKVRIALAGAYDVAAGSMMQMQALRGVVAEAA
jgi:DNA polymerase-3 subunit alpha